MFGQATAAAAPSLDREMGREQVATLEARDLKESPTGSGLAAGHPLPKAARPLPSPPLKNQVPGRTIFENRGLRVFLIPYTNIQE